MPSPTPAWSSSSQIPVTKNTSTTIPKQRQTYSKPPLRTNQRPSSTKTQSQSPIIEQLEAYKRYQQEQFPESLSGQEREQSPASEDLQKTPAPPEPFINRYKPALKAAGKGILILISPVFVLTLLFHTISVPIAALLKNEITHGLIIALVALSDVLFSVCYDEVIMVLNPNFDGEVWRVWLIRKARDCLLAEGQSLKMIEKGLRYQNNYELVYKAVIMIMDSYCRWFLSFFHFLYVSWVLVWIVLIWVFIKNQHDLQDSMQFMITNKWNFIFVLNLIIGYAWVYKLWVVDNVGYKGFWDWFYVK